MQHSVWSRLVERMFGGEIRRQVRAGLAEETDTTFLLGSHSLDGSQRDRLTPDRQTLLDQSLEAWRLNPLARRIIELTTQYVVGSGVSLHCKHPASLRFIEAFWNERLNHMSVRACEWCDELSRSGNLFVLVSTDAAGMSYVRAVPASDIAEIQHRPNDVEQALAFLPRATLDTPDPRPWPAYDASTDAPAADGSFPPIMLHYAINRPTGALWGESDLGSVLRWLSRYANWLEDRARLKPNVAISRR